MKKFKKFIDAEDIIKFEKEYAKASKIAEKLGARSNKYLQELEDYVFYALQNKERVITRLTNSQAKYLKEVGYCVKQNGHNYIISY